ncbi:MAG: efflux RND transporter periplasmic adaptor subunit [Alphaproteobacteria bacterium]|nr:efflux RND transporter periplasmic adaptor subunit [Alphaproteobacteria bacterium]MBU0804544.1 efflux RND transporter periplasmic adaptor subunit [Alphaproteobacteria bacterium]MBU0872088.1 efflux RND transporter periplasmic adaptor subunit [Alphaproteobacteria bacterium]MBU1403180.1 efflux RND transporter periplasmic adaptor subunit [Alphaproteobacteria bacterium]MBU1592964.1 efflux RND transporter periplasmic adaptor subunit [Alphaproteobacteria bacterium]
MAAWKQFLVVLVLLVAAAAAWVKFFPGAPDVLARWGIDWASAAVAPKQGGSGEEGSRRQRGPQTAVVVAPVRNATINDKLSAIGTGRANRSVTVNPYDSGRLTEILVESGQTIEQGGVIARLDAEAEEIAVDRARIALDDAQARMKRITALRTSNTATAVQVTEADLALSNAQLALRDSELALDRRSVRSPISGIVGIVPVEAGNYVTTQTAIVTIEDRSTIIVDFWVPERYASGIAVGAPLSATPIARPNEVLEGTVSAVDNRLDEESRTLLVQAKLDNARDTLRPGMSFQVSMRFPGDTYPSVDPLAIQWGTDGAFVWAVRDGRAVRVSVRIVQRNTESVLVSAELTEGDSVVTEGVHVVRDGAELLIASNRAQPAGIGANAPAATGSGT